MKRREALLAAGALVAAPLLRAQSARKPARVGVLSSTTPETRSTFWDAFRSEMTRLGWNEGRDLNYLIRYTRGDFTRFDALAAELVAEKPDVIYASTSPAALAAKRATRDIPIVFGYVGDPVELGLVASLSHPGGNVTGMASLGIELSAKYLELLKEIQPALRRVSVLAPVGIRTSSTLKHIARAGQSAGVKVVPIEIAGIAEIDTAFKALASTRPDSVVVLAAGGLIVEAKQIAERMTRLRIPAVYNLPEMVAAGGLMSYGADLADNLRQAAGYVDRILKGAKPADLPVEQPTKFELVINLRAAKAIGIAIPRSMLVRATRVIE